jgi:hypothetical protein
VFMQIKERKEFDFFISHASEDKDTFVRMFANRLVQKGFKVWYDENILKLGDSLFEEISNGIKKSDFGIVVLSKAFLKKEWTKKEVNGLISKEIFTSNKVVLPIWLDITTEEIFSFSPILADKVSIRVTSSEIDKAIDAVLSISGVGLVSKEMIGEKAEFLQNCAEDERKKYFIDLDSRVKNLVHFQEAFYNWFCSDEIFKDDDDWDDLLVEEKCRKLQCTYNLPYNVTYNSEFGPGYDMNVIIRLAKKWVAKKATIPEIHELIFLTDWYHELDFPYIVWGYPQESLEDEETFNLSYTRSFEISKNKTLTKQQISSARKKTMNKYFGTAVPIGLSSLKECIWF